ncbi:aminodeoxychorismate/anthranilate synthase component II [Streptomyces nitrosporeus]|uniref:Aminodeoxychorismate synthase n=1 Tax=Streptomyces nitrosporeus TaxID=28894 RepID=A0A5J6FCH9_9ACTN|nr:aminodeoxychorismate/anthranilate synthase component II [Streptomyces nitrosporeus]QEU73487.1 aminodeoxychorismate/anthranilate synthase component II [Streptomyces nitrosporeus]GGZ04239.1 aminodeoxychorismate/anthranilate synthase component II [Streptomyces nitrosporeus]
MSARILVVDNYDSFVFNLVQYLYQLGAECEVVRNDEVTTAHAGDGFDGVLLSPGPGTPEQAGVCVEMVHHCADAGIPVFGVCLGMQSMAVAYGGVVGRAPELLHGKTSPVFHEGEGVFAGLPSPFTATRYHSLAAEPDTVPGVLEVTARTADGIIMGLRHRERAVEGVQFHPESVLTEHGHLMLANWLERCGDTGAVARSAGLAPVVGKAAA